MRYIESFLKGVRMLRCHNKVEVTQTDIIRRYRCAECGQTATTIELDQAEIYRMNSRYFYTEQRARELREALQKALSGG